MNEAELYTCSAPQLPSAHVVIVRRAGPAVKRLISGYEFGFAEPYYWDILRVSSWYRGAIRPVSGSDIAIHEPGEICNTSEFSCPTDFRMLTVDPRYVLDVLSDAGFKGSHLRPEHFRDEGIHATLRRACTTIEDPAADDLERECMVREVIIRCFTQRGERAPPVLCTGGARASAHRAREYISAHACTRISLDEIASVVGISKYYLERIFRAEFGAPIHKYLKAARVERAISLIRDGHNLAEIAASVGFADQAHMTRVFRSTWGFTPSAFRTRVVH